MKLLLSIALILFVTSCGAQSEEHIQSEITIAFGSCNKHDKEQPLWDDILADKPDVWVWLGDNIYGDTEDMNLLRSKYDSQKQNTAYQSIVNQTKVVGVWDDHDYGANDAGKEYSKKQESQQILFDFLDISKDDPIRNQEGAYSSHQFEEGDLSIRLILLDSRYFRDPLERIDGVYQPNLEGDILGNKQWAWFENELNTFQEDVLIIGNGIQVISEEHRFEKWANFPAARERFFSLIDQYNIGNVILLSGDRHIAEVSKQKYNNTTFYDCTSSGLTHSYLSYKGEPNKHRISPVVSVLNYGLLNVAKTENNLSIELKIKGNFSSEYFSFLVDF